MINPMSKNATILIYHHGDLDGICAAAELYKEEAKKISGRVELIHNGRSTEAIHKEILGKLRGIASISM
jgi:single-stranded DNA-specific DHH superfamily exonuclease